MKTPATTTSGVSRRGRQKKQNGQKKRGTASSSSSSSFDKSKINVKGLVIDIENITDEQLYALRKEIPRKDYRLLKNRKSARKSRKRRKQELSTLREEIDVLKKENKRLMELLQQKQENDISLIAEAKKIVNNKLTSEQAIQVTPFPNYIPTSVELTPLANPQDMITIAEQKKDSGCPSILKPMAKHPWSQIQQLLICFHASNSNVNSNNKRHLNLQSRIPKATSLHKVQEAQEKLVDKTVNIITNDGRNFIGTLISFDQKTNVILSQCMERIYLENKEVQAEEMGVFFIRGDNISVIGEIDENLEKGIDYNKIKAQPLKSVLLH
ncbi:n-alpha-acetyltransferase auxiliary subunit-like [Stylonychia lemnae]|uniref:N-alpha-acetyltransferase auxiliary subunit-like n=1 Tax=Stylonychia lemnae TaxID=5949 RepID=A0A078BAS1_STYLE|nr:n-alpha-acetyltransferase auxiliary subunit-like [Stylonychia lemnae]|eukprot:CDW91316.1 n-alpha-acetyltransferase auxiliary subunit-like [Stylonychia lemnae]